MFVLFRFFCSIVFIVVGQDVVQTSAYKYRCADTTLLHCYCTYNDRVASETYFSIFISAKLPGSIVFCTSFTQIGCSSANYQERMKNRNYYCNIWPQLFTKSVFSVCTVCSIMIFSQSSVRRVRSHECNRGNTVNS